VGLAACLLPATALAATSATGNGGHVFAGALSDLAPAAAGPFDGARARLTMANHHGSSTFVLNVKGIDVTGLEPSAVGVTYGAHLHTGPCVAGNGAAAGPHYNADVVPPVTVSDRTEVWLDFTVGANGSGHAVAHVPFVPEPGTRAVVIHQEPTNELGGAGPRLACLPVVWP